MPTLTVADVQYFYTDSGPPDTNEYTTLVLVHGFTFHSDVFHRLAPIAGAHGMRTISVNRRGYPGSTPYTPEEENAVKQGSEADREEWLNQQGRTFALFLEGLIDSHNLPENGGIGLVGWSMGNLITTAFVACVSHLPPATRKKLQAYLKAVIVYDASARTLGIPIPPDNKFVVISDQASPQARSAAFAKYASGHFRHGDLSARDFALLEQRTPDSSKPSTSETMTQEELLSMMDSTAARSPCELHWVVGESSALLLELTRRALLDEMVRSEWSGTKFCVMYGSSTMASVIWAAWYLEKEGGSSQLRLNVIDDANHFLMWEDPARFLDAIDQCIRV